MSRMLLSVVGFVLVSGAASAFELELLKSTNPEELRRFVVYKDTNPLGGNLVRIVECDKAPINHSAQIAIASSKDCNFANTQGMSWYVPYPHQYQNRLKHFLELKDVAAIRREIAVNQKKKDILLAELIEETQDAETYGSDLYDPAKQKDSLSRLDRTLERLNAELTEQNHKQGLYTKIVDAIEKSDSDRVVLPGSTGLALYAPFAYESETLLFDAYFASSFKDGTLRQKTLHHTAAVVHAAFSGDENYVVTSSSNDAKVWDTRTTELLFTLQHKGPVLSAYFVQGQMNKVVSLTGEGDLHYWELPGDIKEYKHVIFTQSKQTVNVKKGQDKPMLTVAEADTVSELPPNAIWTSSGKQFTRYDFTQENPEVQTIELPVENVAIHSVENSGKFLLTQLGWLNLFPEGGKPGFEKNVRRANYLRGNRTTHKGYESVQLDISDRAGLEQRYFASYYLRTGNLQYGSKGEILLWVSSNEDPFFSQTKVKEVLQPSSSTRFVKWSPSGLAFAVSVAEGDLALVRLATPPHYTDGALYPKLRK